MEPKVTFFLGANTPSGFYSLYDQMLEPEKARRVFLLKGGAGCGKSSLMRRVAAKLEEAGRRTEYIVCSGDPDSLDAVIFPDLGAAIVDATAPHVIEPHLPGVVESYVNLGRFYDHAALAPLRPEIEGATDGYKEHYKRAYRCLTAAAQLFEDNRALLTTPALEAKALKRARGILSREVKKTGRAPGKAVQRFLGAISCQGVSCRFDTADILCRKVYELKDSYGLAAGMLTALAAGVMSAGYDVILCPSPLFPDRAEHLLIPELSLAFLTSTWAGVSRPALSPGSAGRHGRRRAAQKVQGPAEVLPEGVRRPPWRGHRRPGPGQGRPRSTGVLLQSPCGL